MNLRDLDPKWIVATPHLRHGAAPAVDKLIGLRFLCPVHHEPGKHGIRCEVAVYFSNPINSPPAINYPLTTPLETDAHQLTRSKMHRRRGDRLEALTIDGAIDHGHWTGRVRNGAVVD